MSFPPFRQPGTPADPPPPDPLEDLEAEYADRRREKANGAGDNGVDRGDIGEPPVWPEEPAATPIDGADWLRHAQRSRTGGPIPNLHNCLLALRNDPHWAGQFRFDEMAASVVTPEFPCTDLDAFRVHEWMQANGLPRLGIDPVREAIQLVGRDICFHPVRDWLNGLQWDGVQRLGLWVHTYLGAEDNAYHSEIGQKFLIALVARVFQPGCKSDYMPVLEGPQRTLKSTACRVLVGEPHFCDNLPELGGGDYVRVAMHLRGKWLIEISELSAFNRADAAKLKQFLSSAVEHFTPKFGHHPVREPRQCLFIGTTNDKHYLRDPTGGTRYWPIVCGTIDIPALERDRNQLFAEAAHQYNLGATWWPEPRFEREIIIPIQDERFEADAWDQPILAYLMSEPRTTIVEIAKNALELPTGRIGTADQRRIAAILRAEGWVQHKGSGGARYWLPPSKR